MLIAVNTEDRRGYLLMANKAYCPGFLLGSQMKKQAQNVMLVAKVRKEYVNLCSKKYPMETTALALPQHRH